jgi:biotin carboxyl carrier protein
LIDESEYLVKYSKSDAPEIFNENNLIKKDISNTAPINNSGVVIKAPLSGNIFKIIKNENENLVLDDTVIVLEAMKMETTIKTPVPGKVLKIFVKNGDKVSAGDPLFEVAE